ncbi:MAG: D-alanyl-D-alanine carboxypeptidase family protein [Sandaracinus sp.]|nr:D-alanyl-D-alanine carboxypeptidase family protein [Sandaracinus sp.]
MRSLLLLGLLLAFGFVPSARAQTVRDLANRGACSTAGLDGISAQLAEAQMCLRPGAFVRFAPAPGITLSSSRIHPFLQASARDALHRAASRTSITINSAFRTLADQYVLYHSGGCGLAARPGQSNHQTGRAVDVQNYSAARSALEGAGCSWLGSSDPVHFDCPGTDRRSDAILAFQKLWNVNNPSDRIDEDGLYGPQTESRLGRTPAAGFARGACGCDAACDGNTIVRADCSRETCEGGLTCTAEGGLRCVDPACPATGSETRCDGDGVLACENGSAARMACDAGEVCMASACVSAVCGESDGDVCVDGSTVASCVGGALADMRVCDFGCTAGTCLPAPTGDASVGDSDAGVPSGESDGGFRPVPTSAKGGCSAAGDARGLAPLLLLGLFVRRRRRV